MGKLMEKIVVPHHQAYCRRRRIASLRSILIFLFRRFGDGLSLIVSRLFDQYQALKILLTGPILDATDFPARFTSHCQGTQPLGNEGNVISMLLVTWAESFGLDERGVPQVDNSSADNSTQSFSSNNPYSSSANIRTASKNKAELYLREILELVDCFSLLRRPSLDGLRVLFLLLPLMEGESSLYASDRRR